MARGMQGTCLLTFLGMGEGPESEVCRRKILPRLLLMHDSSSNKKEKKRILHFHLMVVFNPQLRL